MGACGSYAQSFLVNKCRAVTSRLLPFSLGVDDKRAYQALSKNVVCHDSKVPLRLLLLWLLLLLLPLLLLLFLLFVLLFATARLEARVGPTCASLQLHVRLFQKLSGFTPADRGLTQDNVQPREVARD